MLHASRVAAGVRRLSGLLSGLLLVAGLIGPLASVASEVKAASAKPSPKQARPSSHWAFLEQYCYDCHNAADWAGEVAFDVMSEAQIPDNAETMEHVVRKLRGRLMPPPGKLQPDNKSLAEFVAWMEGKLDQNAAQGAAEPGHVGLHRLNRREYANAVEDLLGLSVDAAALLPRDDTEHGFDNVASALQITPSFLDQYLTAARTVAVQALGNKSARPGSAAYFVRQAGAQQTHREGLPLGTRGGAAVEHYFPADGEYLMNIGNLAQALWVYNMEFENKLVVTVDGAQVYETTIGGEEDMKAIDQKQDPAVDAINARLKNIRFRAKAGQHTVAVTFARRTFAESEDRLSMHAPGGGQDRVLRLNNFEIRGPFHDGQPASVSDTPTRRRIFNCYPSAASEEQACVEKIIANLAPRAFRRPLTDEDKQGLLRFYREGRESGDFENGVRMTLTAILASPDFLFRAEAPRADGAAFALSDLELASRLSFFLWSSSPDEQLLSLAAAGKLRDPQTLKAQVKRMLADPRSESLATGFAFQWLNIPKLQELDPDPRTYPYASGANDLREDFRAELRLFIDSIFREDRNVLDLLNANHTFVNERLALHYGLRDIKGARFRRVTLDDSLLRNGLLGKGAILSLTSYPNRTSVVLRGAWIMEHIVGAPPTPPPPNVEALKENPEGKVAKTLRERMAAHSTKSHCHACHGVIDPLGFALENFDGTGKFRVIDREALQPVDTSGVLPSGAVVKGVKGLRQALTSQPDQFVQTLTEKLLTYALGRTLTYRDMPTVRAIVREAARANYRFSSIVNQIVATDAFQKAGAAHDESKQLTAQSAKSKE